MKSGSLSLLEPSGPFQVCTGIALPFTCCNECDISELYVPPTISLYSLLISSILCCSVLISFSLTSSPIFSEFRENNTFRLITISELNPASAQKYTKVRVVAGEPIPGPNVCEKEARLEGDFKRNTKAAVKFLCGSFKHDVMTWNVWRLNLGLFVNNGRKLF